MKKNYNFIKFMAVLLSMATMQLGAQLSGAYTINGAVVTGGTNFQTFTDLAAALTASGVTGPVTVNVAPASGPYNEQVEFTLATGVSSTNSITINGNGNLLTYASNNSSMPYILALTGAEYMFFHNLNMSGTGSYQYVCAVSEGASYNMFSNCTFSCVANTTNSYHIPVVLTADNTYYANYGDSGDNNTWLNCTMYSGMYGVSLYTNYSAPYNTGNSFIGCTITDFYSRGIVSYYMSNLTLKGNIVQRPTRTSSTTTYAILVEYNQGLLLEGNRVHKLFENHLTSTSTTYGIRVYWNQANGGKANPNVIRNNIVSDIRHNGTVYGLYALYIDGYVYHNTISLDHTASTGGTAYGLYMYTQAGYEMESKNNMVSITKGGGSSKYGTYIPISGNITSDYNNYYVNSAGGTNYVGYYNGAHTSLSALQAAGIDANSYTVNPVFTNPTIQNYIPTAAGINNMGTPVGVVTDIDLMPRSSTTPDIGAHEFLSLACAGTPSANSVVTPTYAICPGESVQLGLLNYYSDTGIQYQWQASTTSSVGPFTAVPGATNILYSTPNLTASTWFSVVMTCTNGNGNISPVGLVNVSGITTSVVPYFESFENVPKNNKLPNCSWTANTLGSTALTYTSASTLGRTARTGSKFASFFYLPTGVRSFYTNGIWMDAGVTYSASVWYQTEYYGYSNFTNLAIAVGPNQNTTGQFTVAATNGPAVSNVYKSLSNTFTVPVSGMYYVQVAAQAASGSAQYLSWDDLAITIPCELNQVPLSLSAQSSTVCAGKPVNLTAAGADTYIWNTGDNTAMIAQYPTFNTTYVVTGTSTLTGCSASLSHAVTVNPSPMMSVVSNPPQVCAGKPVTLNAFGAATYNWNTGGSAAAIIVTPTANTTYTVIGSNSFGCSSTVVHQVSVNPLPAVTVTGAQNICVGESIDLTGAGASSYQFNSPSGVINANPANVTPAVTTNYTVTGTDPKGCQGTAMFLVTVDICAGIAESAANGGSLFVYPNPASGRFVVEAAEGEKTLQVTDVTGRIISTDVTSEKRAVVDISDAANGVYYLKVSAKGQSQVMKLIKE